MGTDASRVFSIYLSCHCCEDVPVDIQTQLVRLQQSGLPQKFCFGHLAIPQNPGLCSLQSACSSILPQFSDARPSVTQGHYLEYFAESSPISKSQGENEYLPAQT